HAERLLANASTVLGSSLDIRTTLQNTVGLAVPWLADRCIVEIPADEQHSYEIAVAHTDPAKVELLRELRRRNPLSADRPGRLPEPLRTGQPVFNRDISDEALPSLGY